MPGATVVFLGAASKVPGVMIGFLGADNLALGDVSTLSEPDFPHWN